MASKSNIEYEHRIRTARRELQKALRQSDKDRYEANARAEKEYQQTVREFDRLCNNAIAEASKQWHQARDRAYCEYEAKLATALELYMNEGEQA